MSDRPDFDDLLALIMDIFRWDLHLQATGQSREGCLLTPFLKLRISNVVNAYPDALIRERERQVEQLDRAIERSTNYG